MKDKILTLIIGVLVGAIITTGVFLIINKTNSSKGPDGMKGRPGQSEMGNFTPGEMPSGGPGGNSENPDAGSHSSSRPQPPQQNSNSNEGQSTTTQTNTES